MKSIITWLGQPIVDVDGDKAKPVEGVTAQQLADVLVWQWREIVRLRAKHHRDMQAGKVLVYARDGTGAHDDFEEFKDPEPNE